MSTSVSLSTPRGYGYGALGGSDASQSLLKSSPQRSHQRFFSAESASTVRDFLRAVSIKDVYAQSQQSFKWKFFRLSLLCLTGYLAISLAFYGYIFESWGALRGVYFAIVTLTSVGFGDLCPTNEYSRLFTIFFALLGISLVALAVSQIAGYIKESHEEKLTDMMRTLAEKLTEDPETAGAIGPLEKTASERRAARREFIVTLMKALFPVILVNLIGAGTIGALEGWDGLDTAYYAVVTSTTIGYGDMHPTKKATYWVAIFYIPLAVVAVGDCISNMVAYTSQKADEERKRELLNRAYEWEGLFRSGMDDDGDGAIDKYEFVVYMLKLWGVVDESLLHALEHRFQELDTDHSGRLTSNDFKRDHRQRVVETLLGGADNRQRVMDMMFGQEEDQAVATPRILS